MQARTVRLSVIATMAALALAGCGDQGDPKLMNIRTKGPDEFAIIPPKPLEMPESLNDLPAPTPGGSNRSDQRPLDDAVVALGGRPGASTGIPAADGSLFAHASRFGLDGAIRQTLAAEDLEWRRKHNGLVLERLLNVNVYYKAYRKMSLDQHAELARWRKAGARTPSAPPPKDGE
ncbi:DUF3035 domain-containing protein [Pseudogemmobacter blasticus]|uniref:DUF3035 domain-containing protein n=1 Tax=Fuscovulum blasticum DSM 2131 TaxID=1188250 RepID=A0A2T4J9P3_FUSBL|nr:DUF3035 domain-containing protein [Fuscovulum blasticum]AWD21768.1 pyruvate/2-oxoglutarate dehydrogenase complex, dihydrolipoamide acyltransferase (E2) component [Fuscovulum blasticum]PTE14619.1 DUF3035 domain-containing protein [Fuscovulum blasticum DSM 2131]